MRINLVLLVWALILAAFAHRLGAADEQPVHTAVRTSQATEAAPPITVTVKRPTPDDKLRLRDAQLHSQSVFIALLQSPQYVAWQKAAAVEERVAADIEKAAGCKLDMMTADCAPKEVAKPK